LDKKRSAPEKKNIRTPNKVYTVSEREKYIEQIRHRLTELPAFCTQFVIGIEPSTTVLTRFGYIVDLRTFFIYMVENEPEFSSCETISDITLEQLEKVKPYQIERYLSYLDFYTRDSGEKTYSNLELGKSRKLAAVRSLYKYLYHHELIAANPASLVAMPKKREKPIIRLEPDEVARLLDQAESGQELTEHQKRYHKQTMLRDVAILTVFLGTGIRISECVGLNIGDLDFESDAFVVTRKGNKRQVIYFWEEVEQALKAYLEQRKTIKALPGHEDALFLSLQKRRITTRAVENLVKKYSQTAAPLKKISPHKLRSTYGTTLYRQTEDIYLVADVLGHNDVNVTRRHYAAMAEDKRRAAARAIRLRDDE